MDHFYQALKRWPVVDSPKAARKAWEALSPEDRAEAVSEIDRFVAVNRSAGRKLICSFAKYLAERMWKALPERAPTLATKVALLVVAAKPTRFQMANKHLYPELFGEERQEKVSGSS